MLGFEFGQGKIIYSALSRSQLNCNMSSYKISRLINRNEMIIPHVTPYELLGLKVGEIKSPEKNRVHVFTICIIY